MSVVVLENFKPKKQSINLNDITIKFKKTRELESTYGEDISNSVRLKAGEWKFLAKKQGLSEGTNFNEIVFTVFEFSNNEIPAECIKTLSYMVFNIWPRYLEREKEVDLSISNLVKIKYDIPYVNLTQKKLDLIEKGYRLLNGGKNENKRFKISLLRWGSSYTRYSPLDSVLDCCSSLEALLSLPDELRLRLSLSVYHILRSKKKEMMLKTYEMYGIRNDFIHGGNIPKIDATKQKDFINLVATVLLAIISDGTMPDREVLNKKIIETY